MLRWCCDDVAGTLRRRGLMARKVMVKLRFPDLSYATKGHTLDCPTDAASMLYPPMCRIIAGHDGHAGKLYRRHFLDQTGATCRHERGRFGRSGGCGGSAFA